jgi:hypothetical protein
MSLTINISRRQTVPENARENSGLVSGGLAEAAEFYRQLGFDSGYGRAVADQLEFSVAVAEQVLREHAGSLNGPADARRLLYTFIQIMERRLDLFADLAASRCDPHVMEGGLGI